MTIPVVDGFLNINKPRGITSMEVVRRIKKHTGQRKVGHAGTLDPDASGVLPICFGQGTRLMDYLVGGQKTYEVTLKLGISTDSYDAAGEVTQTKDYFHVDRKAFEEALEKFKGVISQVPPMYSALKVGGKRLYELARSGVEVSRPPRMVEIYDLEVTGWSPPHVKMRVRCGRGVYIRSLAHDIGQVLDCGAHINDLMRIETGTFDISGSISLSEFERGAVSSDWVNMIFPIDYAVRDFRAALVRHGIEDLISHGKPIPVNFRFINAADGDKCRVYNQQGRFIALLSFDVGIMQWRPVMVFQPR